MIKHNVKRYDSPKVASNYITEWTRLVSFADFEDKKFNPMLISVLLRLQHRH